MKLKVRPSDFKVTERLADGIVSDQGPYRVYRVRKEKLTSLEAATELAGTLGVPSGEIGLAGLKDRQGVTTQYMSARHGAPVNVNLPGLSIQSAGFAAENLDASASEGNDFQIVARDLSDADIDRLRESIEPVRTFGLPNYFDSQRFGNLRHGQGWIALDLLKGDVQGALQRLVASASPFEPPAKRRLKDALWRSFGDWGACRSIAGKLGRYHSVFEHLRRDPEDFAGAFHRVATRERLIHLYAFQSHLFNRALALHVAEACPDRFAVNGIEGKLRFPNQEVWTPEAWDGQLMLPGERLEGVDDPDQRALYGRILGMLGIEPEGLVLPDVPGFQLKPEPRPARVVPIGLRVRPAEDDNEFRGRRMVKLQFGLPRGAYATLVVQRLVGPGTGSSYRPDSQRDTPRDAQREGGERGGYGRGDGDGFGDGFGNGGQRRSSGGRRGGGFRGGARGGARGGSSRRGGRGGSSRGRGGSGRGGSRGGGSRGRR